MKARNWSAKLSLAIGIVLILLSSTPTSTSAYYKRVVKDCDWDAQRGTICGYVRVYRDHNTTDIWCENPGAEPCPLRAVKRADDGSEFVHEDEQRCVDYALEQIAAGNLNGEWVDPSSGKRVVWSATAPTGGNMTIEVTP